MVNPIKSRISEIPGYNVDVDISDEGFVYLLKQADGENQCIALTPTEAQNLFKVLRYNL